MFDNLFTSSPGVWGGLIATAIAVPILIHLINLMRHETVKWAAMEFLLKSHQKNKNWVWLKQLFLLLSRIAALLLALLMLGQIGCDEDRISRLLGGATTHHYVLLDDSFSMSDRGSDGSAFDRARSTLSLIGARAKNRQNQLVSLFRFSSARPGTNSNSQTNKSNVGQLADLNGELVDNLFDQQIEEIKARLSVSNLSIGIEDSLGTVAKLISERENENAIVYVLSDFRQKDWENSAGVANTFAEIHGQGAAVELINCVNSVHPNLALTELEAQGSVRVAGTPLMMKVTVKNCADVAAENVQVKLGSLAFSEPAANTVAEEVKPDYLEIPTVFIDSIQPGDSQTRSFPVYFQTTGQHVVLASLPDDAIAIDNQRWNTTRFSNSVKVLMIDDQSRTHSSFLSLALSPGGMTGIEPETQTREFLRDASFESLQEFDVVFLLDAEPLDESAVKNLEAFANAGGGVVFFLGPNTNVNTYNSLLYRNGAGIFPIPLGKVIEIPEQLEVRVPDISPTQHPMFAPVLGGTSSLLDLVQVKQIIQPSIEWNSQPESTVEIIATVRGFDSWPLAVEKSFGNGRVIAFTTTAGPIWNNWWRNATFPPIMLLLQDYVAAGKYLDDEREVGSSVKIEVASDSYTPNVTILAPGGSQETRLISKTKMNVSNDDGKRLTTMIGRPLPSELVRETDLPGIFDVWLRRTDSTQEVRRFTLNIDPSESEMAIANQQKLLTDLEDSKPSLVEWDQFSPEPKQKPASALAKILLVLLVSVLIIEQLLAYSTSYHPSRI